MLERNYPRLIQYRPKDIMVVGPIGNYMFLNPIVSMDGEKKPIFCASSSIDFCKTCPLLKDCPRPANTKEPLHRRPIPIEKIKLTPR